MPTIPLYDPTAAASAWHNVRAPGGWELWLFHVELDDASRRFSIGFFTGYPNLAYRRAYARFMHHPTRHAPPLPVDYAAVRVSYSSQHEVLLFPPGSFAGSIDSPRVTLGSHHLTPQDDGSLLIQAGEVDRIEMRFVPLSPMKAAGENRVTIGRASVEGTITSHGQAAAFRGHGDHSYQFGLSLLELPDAR